MSRVARLASPLGTAALLALALLAAGLVAIGALLALAAPRVAALGAGAGPTSLVAAGVVLALGGTWLAVRTAGSLRAIAAIELSDDGAWLLRGRFGGARASVAPAARRLVSLRGYRLHFIRPGGYGRNDVVDGTLALDGGGRFRLAASGPTTWDAALATLGHRGPAPRPGERLEWRVPEEG